MARRKKRLGAKMDSEKTQPPVKYPRLMKVWAWIVANQPFTAYGGCFALGFFLGAVLF